MRAWKAFDGKPESLIISTSRAVICHLRILQPCFTVLVQMFVVSLCYAFLKMQRAWCQTVGTTSTKHCGNKTKNEFYNCIHQELVSLKLLIFNVTNNLFVRRVLTIIWFNTICSLFNLSINSTKLLLTTLYNNSNRFRFNLNSSGCMVKVSLFFLFLVLKHSTSTVLSQQLLYLHIAFKLMLLLF